MVKLFYTTAISLLMAGALSASTAGVHEGVKKKSVVRGKRIAASYRHSSGTRVSMSGKRASGTRVSNMGLSGKTVSHKAVSGKTVSGKFISREHVSALRVSGKDMSNNHVSKEIKVTKVAVKETALADADILNVSRTFELQKGHLSWPVDSKKITVHFGLQTYKDMESIRTNILGVSIAADKGAEIKAAFDGVVDDIIDLGDAQAVLVKHGSYITIYNDLSEVTVAKGQLVTTGEVLGHMGNAGALDFRIFDAHNDWLDPEKWLVR